MCILYSSKDGYFLAIAVLLSKSGQYISKQKGQSVSFNCTADGNPQPVIVWRKNGELLLNTSRRTIVSSEHSNGFHSDYFSTTSVITITNLRGSDNGGYSCQVKNAISIVAVLRTPYVLQVIERKWLNELILLKSGIFSLTHKLLFKFSLW